MPKELWLRARRCGLRVVCGPRQQVHSARVAVDLVGTQRQTTYVAADCVALKEMLCRTANHVVVRSKKLVRGQASIVRVEG